MLSRLITLNVSISNASIDSEVKRLLNVPQSQPKTDEYVNLAIISVLHAVISMNGGARYRLSPVYSALAFA